MKNRNLILMAAILVTTVSVQCVSAQNYSRRSGRSSARYNSGNRQSTNTMRSWSQGLVTDRDHNFGIVARASNQEHVFEFKNTTGSDLFLTSVRTSCGCTKPTILTSQVKPDEIARLKAKFDTYNFFGERGATLTVSVHRSGPSTQFGELQFSVKGTIRRDVVLSPGEINFESVDLGSSSQRIAKVLYAGNPQWKILEVKSTNTNVSAEAREVARDPQTGRTTYELLVNITGDQPAGTLNEFLTIVTNDPKTNGMPVNVKGRIRPLIEFTPIQLGVINKGHQVKKKLILRSAHAISIDEIKTNDPRIQFESVDGEKTLHILKYTLDTSKTGQINREITIVTNGPEKRETKVPFSVQIVPATIVNNGK